MQARMTAPLNLVERHPLPLQGIEQRPVPVQDVDAQVPAQAHQCVEKIAQRLGKGVRLAIPDQAQTGIDIPTENEHGVPRLAHRFPEGAKIGRAVNEKRQTFGM